MARFARRLELFVRLQAQAASLLQASAHSAPLVQLLHGGFRAGALAGAPLATLQPIAALKALAAEAGSSGGSAFGARDDPIVAARVGGVLCGLRDPLGSVPAIAAAAAAAAAAGGAPGGAPLALDFVRFSSPEGRALYWHSGAHVLGAALEAHYGAGAHLLDGPALLEAEGGFFYDAALPDGLRASEEVYGALEAAARAVVGLKAPFERLALTRPQAEELFCDAPFKLALLERIPAGEALTAYRCGPFVDLCRGPHVPHTGVFGALRLYKSSGSHGGADAALAQRQGVALQRFFAIAFPTPPQLAAWGAAVEEAKLRDHRLIGKAQGLFFFHDLSPGSAFLLPHGTRILNRLTALLRSEYRRRGYEEVSTPLLYKKGLWATSGHLEAYAENMYSAVRGGLCSHGGHAAGAGEEEEAAGQGGEGEYGIKPMNCPGHCLIFAQRLVTYRDLPLRLADFSALHRNEASGALGGLTRLRRFSQDDAHIFCTEAQIGAEVAGCLDFIAAVYRLFGFSFRAVLSTRPESGSVGDDATWAAAERELGAALRAFLESANSGSGSGSGSTLEVDVGGGAFYGPKIDVFVKDALGREHQCATVQLDFNLPRRFGLNYRTAGHAEGSAGEAAGAAGAAAGAAASEASAGGTTTAVPVMIHRAVLGSLERFMGILIEHTAGKWPFWLSPRQILLCTVSERHEAYARRVSEALRFPPVPPQQPLQQAEQQQQQQEQQLVEDSTLWVDIDASSRTVNKKVREGQGEAYNLLILLGDEEEKAGTASVRFRDAGSLKAFEVCLEEVAGGVGAWKQRGVGSGTWAWGGGAAGSPEPPPGAARPGKAQAQPPPPSAGASFASPLVTLPVPALVAVCRRMQLRRL